MTGVSPRLLPPPLLQLPPQRPRTPGVAEEVPGKKRRQLTERFDLKVHDSCIQFFKTVSKSLGQWLNKSMCNMLKRNASLKQEAPSEEDIKQPQRANMSTTSAHARHQACV